MMVEETTKLKRWNLPLLICLKEKNLINLKNNNNNSCSSPTYEEPGLAWLGHQLVFLFFIFFISSPIKAGPDSSRSPSRDSGVTIFLFILFKKIPCSQQPQRFDPKGGGCKAGVVAGPQARLQVFIYLFIYLFKFFWSPQSWGRLQQLGAVAQDQEAC
jgi:hypothetical protein